MKLNKILKEAQKVQAKLAKIQEELAERTVEASSGGGMVTVVVNGKMELVDIKIEKDIVSKVDLVYCDVAQPDQTEIAAYNSDIFLKSNGKLLLAIKSRSIDVTKAPAEIYRQEAKYLKKRGYEIIDIIDLEPYEKDHAMIYALKRK